MAAVIWLLFTPAAPGRRLWGRPRSLSIWPNGSCLNVPMTAEDSVAHRFEHSLEVQLPFLQFRAPHVSIVPICISRMPLKMLLQLGEGLARAASLSSHGEPLIVASTDMTHYESGKRCRKKDCLALEKVLALDPEGLYEVVHEHPSPCAGSCRQWSCCRRRCALGAATRN